MKLNLKFNAMKVDEIEKSKGLSIENCIADDTINNLCLFIQKGLIDENGRHGVSRTVALDVIDEYLQDSDKNELLLDIMEALVDAGFLSRTLDMKAMREVTKRKTAEATEKMNSL